MRRFVLLLTLVAAVFVALPLAETLAARMPAGGPGLKTTVAAGDNHAVVIKADGSLWSWGWNDAGQLGRVVDAANPATKPGRVGSWTWASVACGAKHVLAINGAGLLCSWGLNDHGQLGLSDYNPRNAPQLVSKANDWATVAAGGYFSLATTTKGTLFAWGGNASGQLGLGDTANRNSPLQVGTASDWVGIACGGAHALALKSDGSLWSWGNNARGQLGRAVSGTAPATKPGRVGMTNDWVGIACGAEHSLGLKADGTLWAWGLNDRGQLGLGLGDTANRNEPTRVGGAKNWYSVAACGYSSFAVSASGTRYAWGGNGWGQLGLGDATHRYAPTTLPPPPEQLNVPVVTAISGGQFFSLALRADGSLQGSGENGHGELGIGTTNGTNSLTGILGTATLAGAPALQIGGNCVATHTLAIKPDGSLWAWGHNSYGQLGLGTVDTARHNTPARVGGAGNRWRSFAVGAWHGLAIMADGTLWSWGNNGAGELGRTVDATHAASAPNMVGTVIDRWRSAAGGNGWSLAIKADGSLWSWGSSSLGHLGRIVDASHPANRPGLVGSAGDRWLAVACGADHTLAIKADGTLWSWGSNPKGQLGVGNTTSKDVPTRVGTSSGWVSVACGNDFSFALKSDGSLWSWGANSYGELGLGYADQLAHVMPFRVPAYLYDWVSVAAGLHHALATRAGGSLWVWGLNDHGELGLNSIDRDPHYTPVKLGLGPCTSVVCGQNHSVVAADSRNIYGWGENTWGQLGLSDPGPVQPSGPTLAFYLQDLNGPAIASIASSTHPNEMLWYVNRSPVFTWSASDVSGIAGYSCTIDRTPTSVPAATINSTVATTQGVNLYDGTWYVHVRACDKAGNWGPVMHRAARIDTTAPAILSLSSPTHPVPTTAAPDPVRFDWTASFESSLASTTALNEGSVAAEPRGVAFADPYGFVAIGNWGIKMFKHLNPAAPAVVAKLALPGLQPRGLTYSGNWLYVACRTNGVKLVMVSTGTPALTGGALMATGGEALDVAVDGSYLYIANGAAGLRLVNLANLNQYADFKFTSPSVPAAFVGAVVRDVVVSGGNAYLATSKGLAIVGTSSPLGPVWKGGYAGPDCNGVALQSGFAYLATSTGLSIVSVANPAAPTFKTAASVPAACQAVAASGRYIYLADLRGLDIVDVLSPTAPAPTLLAGGWTTSGACYGLALSPTRYAYIGDVGSRSLLTVYRLPVLFSYVLDKLSGTMPAAVSSASGPTTTANPFSIKGATDATSIIFNPVAAGVYYFHVRAKDQAGIWGLPKELKVTVN